MALANVGIGTLLANESTKAQNSSQEVKIPNLTLNNGVKMPLLGLGTYKLLGQECQRAVLDALSVGYRLIDTAQYYNNESNVGAAIKESSIDRKELFIVTKLQSSRNVADSIQESLKRLQSDYIDLLLIHWVMGNDLEIYKTMEEYYKKGKLKAIGLSNFYDANYFNIINNCAIKPQAIQQEMHVLYQNKQRRLQYQKDEIALMAWSPFGAGRENIFKNPILLKIGEKYGKTSAQVILRFLVQNNIIAIPKTSKKERMKENINIFDFALDAQDLNTIATLDRGKSLFGWAF